MKCNIRLIITFVLLPALNISKLFAQTNIKQFVKSNVQEVKTLSLSSSDFSDLSAIGDAIGDAKVVMLGEQDHGDATTFLAKARLVRYLHEVKGFNVLAFESDFFALNYGWDKLVKNDRSISEFLRNTIYPIWTECDACQSLFYDYIPTTYQSGPGIRITGFDSQVEIKQILPVLDSIVRNADLPIVESNEYDSIVRPLIQNWGANLKDTILNERYLKYLTEIKTQLKYKTPSNSFWLKVIENMEAVDFQFSNHGNFWKEMNIRDQQMASNLQWICEVAFPSDRIIVWGASAHVAKYSGHYPQEFLNKYLSMGTQFTNDENRKKQTYIIGFTSLSGTAGKLYPPTNYVIEKPRSNSFENWIDEKYQYAFVDFRKFNDLFPREDKPFYMSGSSQGNSWVHKNTLAEWTKVFDGVFYIKEMSPCKRIK